MRLLSVVQRYGAEVGGGAETLCRDLATRLAGRDHDVEVVTTCALHYQDWADHYPPGAHTEDGVTVHRLPVGRPRDYAAFDALNERVLHDPLAPLSLQAEWMAAQGPHVPELPGWLEERAGGFDAVVFFTYLYATTYDGLPAARGRAPVVLHPTAHDEWPFWLPLFDVMLRLPDAYACSTEEEAALLARRCGLKQPHEVVGPGVDLPGARHGSFDPGAPYVLCLGRVDPAKGTEELVRQFAAYKERRPGPLKLVLVGDVVSEPPAHPDVVVTGYVDDATKQAALAGATVLVQPSPFESFSLALVEGWAHGVPAVVRHGNDVLRGQAQRAGGGLTYSGYAELEVALDRLLADDALRGALGEAGRRYVEARYAWPAVLDRYEAFLEGVRETGRRR